MAVFIGFKFREMNFLATESNLCLLLMPLVSQNGNITELLLKEGFARCVDWSIAVYTRGAEKLRAAER